MLPSFFSSSPRSPQIQFPISSERCSGIAVVLCTLLFSLALTLAPLSIQAQTPTPVNDGPHVFFSSDSAQLQASWVCNDQRQDQLLATISASIAPLCGYPYTIQLRAQAAAAPVAARFEAKKIAAFSDIHGQFDLMLNLLKANQIIDAQGNWQYGSGHLVIAGDVFDRGPKVTEALWLLYMLEAQAEAAGGKVHYLLGNHEAISLANDLRYLHPKYRVVADKLNTTYPRLFSQETVLGRWLRSKPVIIRINDSLFMHGGLHPDYAQLKLSLAEVNAQFHAGLGLPKASFKENNVLSFLYGSTGPLWYRGYLKAPLLQSEALDQLLQTLQVQHIVVGHTTMNGVYVHWQGRVYSIDSDIKSGQRGEMLFWENGLWT
jgi:hypothetical protein